MMAKIRDGAEVESDPDGVRLKIWGANFDEFVIISAARACGLARELLNAAYENDPSVREGMRG